MDGYERAKLVDIIRVEILFAIWSFSNFRHENCSFFYLWVSANYDYRVISNERHAH